MGLPLAAAVLLLAMTCGCSRLDQSPAANDDMSPTATPVHTPADRGPPLAIAAADPKLQWGPCPPLFTRPGCEIAVLHGDPARPNADILLRIPGGYAIPPHRHSSAERMILVGGALSVRYQGHPEASLATGDYAFGPAGLPHEGRCTSAQPCTLFIAFEGPVDAEPVTGPIG